MRIVGGSFKGRRLMAPEGPDIRPTSDRVRESVFNILEHAPFSPGLNEASVVDLFAGTGAMGFEAISRGAVAATFIEKSARAQATIMKNAGTLGLARQIHLLRMDATALAPPPRTAKAPVAIAFLDPPYDDETAPASLMSLRNRGWIDANSLCVVETPAARAFEPPRGFTLADQRRYGVALISFLTTG